MRTTEESGDGFSEPGFKSHITTPWRELFVYREVKKSQTNKKLACLLLLCEELFFRMSGIKYFFLTYSVRRTIVH